MAKAAVASFAAALALAVVAWRIAPPGGAHGLQFLPRGTPAQLSSFIDEKGARVTIEAFRGRVLILNLWAPWCGACLLEMPALDRLAGKLPPQDFVIFPVSRDGPGDTAAGRAFSRLGLTHLKFYRDLSGKLSAEIGARGLPTTLILAPDGAPVAYREGSADWDSDEMVAYLLGLRDQASRSR